MDEEKVFRNFDWIRTTCEEDEQIRLSFPQYVMYKRHGKTFDCYCTACGRYFEMSEKDKGVNSEIKHWKQGQCPECEADVFFLCGSKVPAKTYYKRRHFVQFRAINGDLYVVAFNAYQIFGTGSFSEWNGISEYDTEYSCFDAQRYLYSSEGVFHWRYNGGWELLKSAHEPVFGGNPFGCYYDNSYAVLSIEEYRNSCMKYSGLAEYLDNHVYDEFGNTTRRVLAFLTTMKKYPDLEKVIKSGFENVVYNCITPEGIKENGVLNLRGKNTQAILGLDRQEMKRLGSGMISVDGLKHWKAFRAVKVNGGIYERDLAYHRFGIKASGPPSKITIKATSLPVGNSSRAEKKSRAWENIRLSGIAAQVAYEGGLTSSFSGGYDPKYSRKEQYNESDMTFLQRLCEAAGISLKVTDGALILYDEDEYEGKPVVAEFKSGDGAVISYDFSDGSSEKAYSSCHVSYTNPTTGVTIEYTYTPRIDNPGTGEVLEINEMVESREEARKLAMKRLKAKNKDRFSASLKVVGNARLAAGAVVGISGWGDFDGRYMVKTAGHDISGQYTTKLTLRKCLEGYT